MRERRKKNSFKKLLIVALGIIALFVIIKVLVVVVSYVPVLYDLAFNRDIDLKKTSDQRVNILLLGIGGGKHDGPNLTDTIIFVSLDPKDKEIRMITLPRDLWSPELRGRINKAYSTGGLPLSKSAIGTVLGQKIDYGFRIDFNGFIKAVDMLGGLSVAVERSFDDYEYPLSGKENDTCGFADEEFEKRATASAQEQKDAFPCRYEHLHFDKGTQVMNGETALKYVRSRHAVGPEGSDFARSKRQENIINAIKDKVFSAGTLLNPLKLASLYDVFKDSIDTDIKKEEYDDFVKLAQKMEGTSLESSVIDVGDENEGRSGLLTNPASFEDYGGAWVLIPKGGDDDYSSIHNYVQCFVEHTRCPSITPAK